MAVIIFLFIYTGKFEISQADEVNFLGYLVEKNSCWVLHVNKGMSTMSSGLFALSKVKYLCDGNTLKMIYFSYSHSVIHFDISLYGTQLPNLLTQS